MAKMMRYLHHGQYLQNTLFWTPLDYISAYHAQLDVFDAELAAEEEAISIASHKQDFAIAFGIPAEEIECEMLPWDGRDESLPFAADSSAPIQRLPEEKRAGYVPPVPRPPTLEEKVAALLAASPQATAALGIVDLVTLDGLTMPATKE